MSTSPEPSTVTVRAVRGRAECAVACFAGVDEGVSGVVGEDGPLLVHPARASASSAIVRRPFTAATLPRSLVVVPQVPDVDRRESVVTLPAWQHR
jgi:hypothetical protein